MAEQLTGSIGRSLFKIEHIDNELIRALPSPTIDRHEDSNQYLAEISTPVPPILSQTQTVLFGVDRQEPS